SSGGGGCSAARRSAFSMEEAAKWVHQALAHTSTLTPVITHAVVEPPDMVLTRSEPRVSAVASTGRARRSSGPRERWASPERWRRDEGRAGREDREEVRRFIVVCTLGDQGEPGEGKSPPRQRARSTIRGGTNARTGGGTPSKRSTWTSDNWPVHPCASRDVPTSAVTAFGLPCAHVTSGADGSNQAPVDNCTTPGRTPSSSTAPARQEPRSLNRRTTSPSAMPRAAASSGCSRTGARSATLAARLCAPMSCWLCT